MTRDRVFISYRRSDAAGSTTAIRKTLLDRFGEQAVFLDVEGIDPGADFPHTLRDELRSASVVLAVIGKAWLLAANEYGQRRIDFEDDWVRTELSIALSDPEVNVIPVLVEGARMPPDSALPPPLRSLTTRNAVTLLHEAWDDTISRLLDRIAQVLKPEEDPGGASEALTVDVIRQVVTEALENMSRLGGQVLLTTVDEMSRIVARTNAQQLELDERSILELLTVRLIGRPVVQVASYMAEFLRYSFSVTTAEGKWLGYALKHARQPFEQLDLLGCVLLLPGNMVAEVRGAFVVAKVTFDYYGASSQGGPSIELSPRLVEVGHRCADAIIAGKPGELALIEHSGRVV